MAIILLFPSGSLIIDILPMKESLKFDFLRDLDSSLGPSHKLNKSMLKFKTSLLEFLDNPKKILKDSKIFGKLFNITFKEYKKL
jgi:hypothetical protein